MQAYQDAYYEGVRPLRAHTIRPASPTTDAGQWKAQKAHAERVASAESAVLDAATQRERMQRCRPKRMRRPPSC